MKYGANDFPSEQGRSTLSAPPKKTRARLEPVPTDQQPKSMPSWDPVFPAIGSVFVITSSAFQRRNAPALEGVRAGGLLLRTATAWSWKLLRIGYPRQ